MSRAKNRPINTQAVKRAKGRVNGDLKEKEPLLVKLRRATIKMERPRQVSLIAVVCGKGTKKRKMPIKTGILWFRIQNIFSFALCSPNFDVKFLI